ncbi:hypothetical protein [Ornithobacterium rhinotracheale]|uniref:hypothetical protein n=1 Tax=Ornithobacterium rhinotracheale TaxID=28251 RepID=UPI0040359FCD
MFEKILNELKTKYKHLGLSEKILKVKAKKLAKSVKDESEIETAVQSVEEDLEIIQSLADQNRTLQKRLEEMTNPTKEKGENESKEPSPKPIQNPKPEASPKDESKMPEWARALNDKIDKLANEKEIEKKTKSFVDKAKELGIKEHFYKHHSADKFNTDAEMDEFLNLLKKDQEDFEKTLSEKGLENHANPIFGGGNLKDEKVSEGMQAFLDSEKSKP